MDLDLLVPEPDMSCFLFKSQLIHIITSTFDTVDRRGRVRMYDKNPLSSSTKLSKKNKDSVIYI